MNMEVLISRSSFQKRRLTLKEENSFALAIVTHNDQEFDYSDILNEKVTEAEFILRAKTAISKQLGLVENWTVNITHEI